jgi:hypothetical protein
VQSNQQLSSQKHKQEDELNLLRERNMNDLQEIERLNMQNEQATNQGEDLSSQVRALEFEISKSLNKTEDMNRQLD